MAVAHAVADAPSRHQRVSAMLTAMAVSYALLWLPFTIVTILLDSGFVVPRAIDECCKALSLCSICVNPLLYAFMNRNFQRELTAYAERAREGWYFMFDANRIQNILALPPYRFSE